MKEKGTKPPVAPFEVEDGIVYTSLTRPSCCAPGPNELPCLRPTDAMLEAGRAALEETGSAEAVFDAMMRAAPGPVYFQNMPGYLALQPYSWSGVLGYQMVHPTVEHTLPDGTKQVVRTGEVLAEIVLREAEQPDSPRESPSCYAPGPDDLTDEGKKLWLSLAMTGTGDAHAIAKECQAKGIVPEALEIVRRHSPSASRSLEPVARRGKTRWLPGVVLRWLRIPRLWLQ